MQRILWTTLLALSAGVSAEQVNADHAWFQTEGDAVHALSDGARLDVFECTQCDVDNPGHRTTRTVIQHLLDELRAHDQPTRGAFLLRERVQPRYYIDKAVTQETAGNDESDRQNVLDETPEHCNQQGWTPSLTRWEYDLDSNEARPQFSACLAFTRDATPIRMSCKGCDLDELAQAPVIREQLKAAHWALFEGREPVASGVIIVTDSQNSGFRHLDFRAYGDTVYLGPSDGDYYRIPLNASPELAFSD